MSPRLVSVRAAGQDVARRLTRTWADHVVQEVTGGERPFEIPLAPGVTSGSVVTRLGFDVTGAWTEAWQELVDQGMAGWTVRGRTVPVVGLARELPATLVVHDLDGALTFLGQVGVDAPVQEVERGRTIGAALVACGAVLTPATLRAACRLADAEVEALTGVVWWLANHPDLGGWTARQLPVPGIHSKWLEQHGSLLRVLTGRDVRREIRPRPTVVHVTYVDPTYLASGRRRHDAWTTGDAHDLAYRPSMVVVVENRDCRLWFQPVEGALVVEGGGKAAAPTLADLPWLRAADDVVYWGDIDSDGFAILDRFRAALALPTADGLPSRPVRSLLMDARALERYEHLGTDRDRHDRPIAPSSATLSRLTAGEAMAYHAVATRGPARLRRIEQERIPVADAVTALRELLGQSSQDGRLSP